MPPSKSQRLEVDRTTSESLRLQVLRRDNWRCQGCGHMERLEVHHLVFRSHGGQNAEENLITLCHACHSMLHNSNVL